VRAREGFAVARDGAPIYYRVLGPPSSEQIPIILLDGIGCDGYVWKYLERGLGDRHRLIHFHYRGHGRTPVPSDRRRVAMADLADDVDVVLEATDTPRAALAGHSMGVQVALETFRRHRDRVAGLVLLCGSYGNPLRTFKGKATLEALLPYVSFAVRHAPDVLLSAWRNLLPSRLAFAVAARVELNAELIQLEDFMPYLEHMARVDPSLFLEMLGHAGRHTAREILPAVDVPTLIVAGERDGFTPRSLSEEMHRLIAGSELLVVEGGSHTAPIERPQLVTDAVARFLAAGGAARARAT